MKPGSLLDAWARDDAKVAADLSQVTYVELCRPCERGQRGQVEQALRLIADQHWRNVEQDFVNAVLAQQRSIEFESGFDVDFVESPLSKFAHQSWQINLVGCVRQDQKLGAEVAQAGGFCRVVGGGDAESAATLEQARLR